MVDGLTGVHGRNAQPHVARDQNHGHELVLIRSHQEMEKLVQGKVLKAAPARKLHVRVRKI